MLHEEVEGVAFAGDVTPGGSVVEGVGGGAVNGFRIAVDPSAHLQEGIAFKFDYRAVAPGTDVQQVIAAAADDVNHAEQFLIDFGVEAAAFLPGAVAPGFFEEGGCRLPRGADFVVRDLVVAHHGEVAPVVSESAANHALRLEAGDKVIEFLALLAGEGAHVKPDFRDGTVLGHDFFHLFHVEAVVFRRDGIRVVRGDGVAGEMPVNQGKINRELDALPLAGFGEFFHGIALERRCVHDVVVGIFRVVHAEAVVVLGGEYDGLHAGGFGEGDNLVRIPFDGVEVLCHCRIFLFGYPGKRLDLFTVPFFYGLSFPYAPKFGIKSEVNEHGILLVQPIGIWLLLCGGHLRHEQ